MNTFEDLLDIEEKTRNLDPLTNSGTETSTEKRKNRIIVNIKLKELIHLLRRRDIRNQLLSEINEYYCIVYFCIEKTRKNTFSADSSDIYELVSETALENEKDPEVTKDIIEAAKEIDEEYSK